MKRTYFYLVMVLNLAALPCFADGLTARCNEDPISAASEAMGRNAWARKCGYIKTLTEAGYNEEGTYIVFTTGKKGGNPDIPVAEGGACIPGLTKLGACQVGCYTPHQRLLFGGQSIGLESAFEKGIRNITALSSHSNQGQFEYEEREIQHYTAGDTDEDIYLIHMDNGSELQVTSEHPLVNGEFTMVKAKDLQAGQSLIHRNGDLVRIHSVETVPYHGKVWNIQPQSKNKLENILIVEDFLTGSVRFQNEWANDLYRLSLRDEL